MKSMKMSEEERAEYQDAVMAPQPVYPWGLQITLDDDALEKLGIKKLPGLDQVLEIRCKAQVTGLHARKESNEEDDQCLNLQITDMEVVDMGDKSAAEKLYRGE